jgi:hypothetical protein
MSVTQAMLQARGHFFDVVSGMIMQYHAHHNGELIKIPKVCQGLFSARAKIVPRETARAML